MVKKTDNTLDRTVIDVVADEDFSSVMKRNFLRYATYVIEDRALCDARDGLKPSQRRIMMTMNDLGLKPGGGTTKCAKITGKTSGEYHPHGTASIYQALARLAQDWVMRYPLVIGQGNFGNIDGDPPASERYTESKLSPYGEAILRDLSEDVVDHVYTYNEEGKEPVVLPGLFPNLICNGCSGIAVGLATEMPSHNLREATEAIRLVIEKPECSLDDILAVMPGPDFPTGGVLLGQSAVRQYYSTGRASLRVEGKYEVKPNGKMGEKLVITEFPPGGNPEKFVTQVRDLMDSKKVEGVSSVSDLTSRDDNDKRQILVELEFGKNVNSVLTVNVLLQHTCLRESVPVNQTSIVGGRVCENSSIKNLIQIYITHRIEILNKKFNAERQSLNLKVHVLEGLISATKRIDEVIHIVRNSENADEVVATLIAEGIVSTSAQALAVLKLTLRQLTKMEEGVLVKEFQSHQDRLKWLEKILNSPKSMLKQLIKDLDDFTSQYGDDRRTIIGEPVTSIEADDLVLQEDIIVSMTPDGYMCRTQGVPVLGNKNYPCSTHDNILLVTNYGLAYRRRGFEFPISNKSSKGKHSAGLLNLSAGEYVVSVVPMTGGNLNNSALTIVTTNGLIKRSQFSDYETSLKNKGINAIKLDSGDQVVNAFVTSNDSDVFLATSSGKAIRYPLSTVRVTGRSSMGVQAIKLSAGDTLAQALSFPSADHPDIAIITSGGYGKRINAMRYRCFSGRSSKGANTIDQVQPDRNGLVVDAVCINNENDLAVCTVGSKVIEVPLIAFKESGKATMGVKLMRLDD